MLSTNSEGILILGKSVVSKDHAMKLAVEKRQEELRNKDFNRCR
jgi:hypothetical protein